MNALYDAVNMATSTQMYGPEYHAAMALCQMRGIDPYAPAPFNLVGWQYVIAEAHLLRLAIQRPL